MTDVPVVTVLRSGGDYTVDHVVALEASIMRRYRVPFVCLTDCPGEVEPAILGAAIPMRHGWPGAWSKLELCRPDLWGERPILFFDLDTTILGSIKPFLEPNARSAVLRDFFRGRRDLTAVQSSMMFLTAADRRLVWDEFFPNRERWLGRRGGFWDQQVYERVLRNRARFWQDEFPGEVIGYKTHIRRPGLVNPPPEARVVIFHGRPRPWDRDAPTWAYLPPRKRTEK